MFVPWFIAIANVIFSCIFEVELNVISVQEYINTHTREGFCQCR